MNFLTKQPRKFPRATVVATLSVFALALVATAGSLTPPGTPAPTFRTLGDIYGAIASDSFDSSIFAASTSGSLINHLKYIEENLGWASSSTHIYNINSGNVGIGDSTPEVRFEVVGAASVSQLYINGTAFSPFTALATLSGTFNTSGIADGVYVSGKYVYVADDSSGLQVIDISNPASPTLEGTFNTSGTAVGVHVSGKFAYVADSVSGLQVIDVSNPSSPALIGTFDTSGFALSVYVSGKYAYVADNLSGLQVIDVSNPSSPALIGTFNTSGGARNVYVSGRYAYVADNASGLQVIDVSNPSSPALIGTFNTSDAAFGVYVSGKYAYVADDTGGLDIIDVSNPSSPTIVGNYDTLGNARAVYVSGKYAYVGDFGSGLHIIDVSDPSSPSLTSTLDTTGSAIGVHLAGKYVYVADGLSGLQIIDVGGLETHALYAGNISTNDITVYENLDVGNNLYVRNGLNVGQGGLLVNGLFGLNASFSANTASVSRANLFSIVHPLGRLAGDALRLDIAASTTADRFTGNFAKFTLAGTPRFIIESSGAVLASGAAQFGSAGAPSSVSYSRFGTAATTHALSAPSDVLISGALEVNGVLYADGGCVGCGGVASDSLDFDEFVDAMTLDANTTIASAGFNLATNTYLTIGSTTPQANPFAVVMKTDQTASFFKDGGGGSINIFAENLGQGSRPVISFGSTGGGALHNLISETGGFTIEDASNTGYFNFRSNSGNSRLYINRDGVGILETSPDARLEIVGSASRDYFYLSSTPAADGDIFTVKNNGNIGIASSSPAARLVLNSAQGNAMVRIGSTSTQVNASGGTASSSTFLGVYGLGGHPIVISNAPGTDNYGIYINSAFALGPEELNLFRGGLDRNSAATAIGLWSESSHDIVFQPGRGNAGATNNYAGIIDYSSGYWGIGSSISPGTILDIQGTASASRLILTNELNVAKGSAASVSYSRFGTDSSSHTGSITGADDLLISGSLEVNTSASFDGLVGFAGAVTLENGVFLSGQSSNGIGTLDLAGIRSGSNIAQFGHINIASISFTVGAKQDAMTIDNGGNVGVGTTNPGAIVHIASTGADGQTLLRLEDSNSTCNFTADAGAPTCGSDIRLKKDVSGLEDGSLARLLDIEVVTYRWKTDGTDAPLITGFIAQDVQQSLPDLVQEATWIDGEPALFLSQNKFIPHLVKAIQELEARLSALALPMPAGELQEGDIDESIVSRGGQPSILERIVSGLEDMVVRVSTLVAGLIRADEVQTDRLCVGTTCVTEDEFRELLELNGIVPDESADEPGPADLGDDEIQGEPEQPAGEESGATAAEKSPDESDETHKTQQVDDVVSPEGVHESTDGVGPQGEAGVSGD